MNELVKINEKEIMVKEFNDERVVTAWDIANVHCREVKTVNQQFIRNKDKLIENEDYFVIKREDVLRSQIVTLKELWDNSPAMKEMYLFTESGYLMLVKTFNDDISWQIQRQLVKGYFKLREILPKIPDENETKRLEIMEKNVNIRLSEQYLKLAEMTGNPRYKEVLIALGTNAISKQEVIPLPKLEQKSYTAQELGKILGISANMVGRIANKHGLKTERYGYLAQDKAKHANKSVESFRYFEHAISKFKDILNGEEEIKQ